MRPFPFGVPDWRAVEARLDPYAHNAAEIDGATVHFMHVASPEPGAHRYCPTCARAAVPPRTPTT
jgi:hypothetical protein